MSSLASDSPYAVELNQVSKIYPGTPPVEALSKVSISVPRGELLGIVGASGSGKSTLLHLVGTLTRPTAGSVFIDG
ncbi:MAG TPA: ABC transporter ATP-binding protein, partial [Dehalococcoidia bacterium]|nr:ABC transporter ATP-binding protein [Dehalococcoidia bacterium]